MGGQLQTRRDLMDGFVLAPTGATVPDAVRTADISIPSNRQRLENKGVKLLTQHNGNDRAGDLVSRPPSLEACQRAVDEVQGRKEAAIARLRAELADAKGESKQTDLSRGERSFWRKRVVNLEEKLIDVEMEAVTGEDLHRMLVREDVSLRAAAVPPEMRAAMEAIERERELVDVPARS